MAKIKNMQKVVWPPSTFSLKKNRLQVIPSIIDS